MANVIATQFPVRTHSQAWPLRVVGMGGKITPLDKATPDGEVKYQSHTILLIERDGMAQPQKSASVHVIHPDPEGYALGQVYAAEGRVFVQPYESNSRVAYSITVERLVPVQVKGGQS